MYNNNPNDQNSYQQNAYGEQPADDRNQQNARENGYYYRPQNDDGNYGGNPGGSNGMPPLNLPPENTGMAVGALVTGIIGIVFSCCCGVGIVPGIIGLILALVDRSRIKRFSGVALGGLICSIIAIVFSITMILLSAVSFSGIDITLWESIMDSIMAEEMEPVI